MNYNTYINLVSKFSRLSSLSSLSLNKNIKYIQHSLIRLKLYNIHNIYDTENIKENDNEKHSIIQNTNITQCNIVCNTENINEKIISLLDISDISKEKSLEIPLKGGSLYNSPINRISRISRISTPLENYYTLYNDDNQEDDFVII
jgi:hypothetical protein